MKIELEVRRHAAVGPLEDIYGHGPVTSIGKEDTVYVCLDCGYICPDKRMLAHTECDREQNGIHQTWREYLDSEEDGGSLPTPSEDEDWPITD